MQLQAEFGRLHTLLSAASAMMVPPLRFFRLHVRPVIALLWVSAAAQLRGFEPSQMTTMVKASLCCMFLLFCCLHVLGFESVRRCFKSGSLFYLVSYSTNNRTVSSFGTVAVSFDSVAELQLGAPELLVQKSYKNHIVPSCNSGPPTYQYKNPIVPSCNSGPPSY